jgi:predicted GH43/DUF377 family glycosyl hydrolase
VTHGSSTDIKLGGASLEVISEDGSGGNYHHIDATPQLPWVRYGIVLDLGESGACDDKSVESPVIIKENDGTYVLWYRGRTFTDKIGRITRAISNDGIHWTKTGVVMEPTDDYEGNKIDPMTVIFEDGIYKMWYGAAGYGGCACYATSSDGINWTKYPGNPVLKKTSGSWDNRGAGGQHCVIRTGNTYKMYYKGYGSDHPGWTFYGLAESPDGINWMKKGKVISPQPELGETTTFKNLFAFRAGDYYCIMHTMADYLHLFLLSSNDGESWCKNGAVFRRGETPDDWDIKWATSPCLVLEDGTMKMWYEGGDPEGRVRALYAEVAADYFFKTCQETIVRAGPPN